MKRLLKKNTKTKEILQMTAREMITISNGVNRNSDEEMIARIEKRIEENASKGKTYVSIPQNRMTRTIFEHFETITSLYLLYVFSWSITAIIELIYFAKIYKEQMKLL